LLIKELKKKKAPHRPCWRWAFKKSLVGMGNSDLHERGRFGTGILVFSSIDF
jgi:hypothetical protein